MSSFARRALTTVLLPATSWYERRRPGIRILMYHRVERRPGYDQLTVQPGRFERQLAALARSRRRVLSLAAAADELASDRPPTDGVVITFDDGYRDNLVHALPVLRRYAIPATIFVTTAFCDQAQRHPRYADEPGRLHLDWEDVRALAREPLVTIGSHTLTHPHLSRLAPEAAGDEIAGSRRRIAEELGRPVDFFCYPSGDLGPREVALVRAAGYRAAVTVAPGSNRAGAPLHELRRTEVTDRDEPGDLAAKLGGAYDLPHRWLHRRRLQRFAAAARHARPAALDGGAT